MRMAHSRSGLWMIGAGLALVLVLLSAPQAHGFGPRFVADASLRLLRAAIVAISEGYRVAPALMLGLALAIGFPLLVVAWRVIGGFGIVPDASRRYRPDRDDDDADAEPDDDAVPHAEPPFVEIESGGKGLRCAIPRDMLRIGREADNDIRIASSAVDRYHAAIYRENYDDWHIADLSGVEGSGLIVNGRRCREALLNDGDLIQLGPDRLRFHAGCV